MSVYCFDELFVNNYGTCSGVHILVLKSCVIYPVTYRNKLLESINILTESTCNGIIENGWSSRNNSGLPISSIVRSSCQLQSINRTLNVSKSKYWHLGNKGFVKLGQSCTYRYSLYKWWFGRGKIPSNSGDLNFFCKIVFNFSCSYLLFSKL